MGDKENGASPLFTSITRKTLLIMINFVMMGIIGVISWKFVATYMPAPEIGGAPNEIGLVTAALSFVGIFCFITNLGFGSSHIKRISQGEDLGKCIGTYFTIQLVSIIVLVGVVFIALTFWADLLGYGYEDPRFEYTVFIILGYYAANNLATVGLQTFVAKVEIAKNQIILFIAALVQLIVTLFVVIPFASSSCLRWLNSGSFITSSSLWPVVKRKVDGFGDVIDFRLIFSYQAPELNMLLARVIVSPHLSEPGLVCGL